MSDGVHFLQDLQASPPDVRIGLSRAGVSGVRKAIRIRYGESEKLIAAAIDCTVDLDPSQKGVHMSRFPELFGEAGYFGHGPIMHDKCFEVPFLEGKIR